MSHSSKPNTLTTTLLLDENVDVRLTDFFHRHGLSVLTTPKGASDTHIIEYADKYHAILVTHDTDFINSDLYKPSVRYGITVLRIHPPTLPFVQHAFEQFMSGHSLSSIYGRIVIITSEGFTVIGASF